MVETQPDEQDLIARSRDGDLAAFNRLVERYQNPLYKLCLRMLSAPQAAEDAAQDAFISAYRSIERFRGATFRAWLFRIAANACYDELRRRRSRPAVSLDAPVGEEDTLAIDLPNPGPSPEEHAQRSELNRALKRSLAALPDEQRLTIVLCDVQGLDYAEIAVAMNVSLGTVKSRVSRARSRLRELVQEHGELLPDRFRHASEERDP